MSTILHLTNYYTNGPSENVLVLSGERGIGPSKGATASTTSGEGAEAFFHDSGGGAVAFYSRPFRQDFTLSGTFSFNFWASQNNTSTNCRMAAQLFRVPVGGGGNVLIDTAQDGTELSTSMIARLGSVSLASTGFFKGDRLMVYPLGLPVGTFGNSLASFSFNAATPAASGDSFVTLSDTLPIGRGWSSS